MAKLVWLVVSFTILQPGLLFPSLEVFRPFFLICSFTLIVFFVSSYRVRAKAVMRGSQGIFLLGLIICESTAIILSSFWLGGTVRIIIDWLKLFAVFILVAAVIDSHEGVKTTIWVVIISATIVFFKGFEILKYHPELMRDSRLASYGMYEGANDFALLLVLIWPLAFKMFEIERALVKKAFLLFLLAFIPYLLLNTVSRGGMLGFFVVSGLSLYLPIPGKSTLNKVKKLMIVPLILAVVAVGVVKLAERKDAQAFGIEDASMHNRIEAWKAGVRMMIAIPWGVGYDNFTEYGRDFGARRGMQAHNTLVKVGTEAGFLGLFSYMGLLYTTAKFLLNVFRKLSARHDEAKLPLVQGILISLIGFCVCTFFSVKEYEFMLYILLGLTFSITRLEGLDLRNFGKKDGALILFGIFGFFLFIKLVPA